VPTSRGMKAYFTVFVSEEPDWGGTYATLNVYAYPDKETRKKFKPRFVCGKELNFYMEVASMFAAGASIVSGIPRDFRGKRKSRYQSWERKLYRETYRLIYSKKS
jgi:hypothetical protein